MKIIIDNNFHIHFQRKSVVKSDIQAYFHFFLGVFFQINTPASAFNAKSILKEMNSGLCFDMT